MHGLKTISLKYQSPLQIRLSDMCAMVKTRLFGSAKTILDRRYDVVSNCNGGDYRYAGYHELCVIGFITSKCLFKITKLHFEHSI